MALPGLGARVGVGGGGTPAGGRYRGPTPPPRPRFQGPKAPHPLIARIAQNMAAKGGQALGAGAGQAAQTTAPPAPAPPSTFGAGGNAGAKPGGGGGGRGGQKPSFHPFAALRNLPGGVLNPRQMAILARAETALSLHPLIAGYKEIAQQDTEGRNAEDQGLTNLGGTLQSNIAGTYKGVGELDARTQALQGELAKQFGERSANISAEGSKNLAGMQTGALGGLEAQLQMRGAPGAGQAQQNLANAVAAQQSQQSQDTQAAQQFAASQAAARGSLLSGITGATGMQAGTQLTGIGKEISSRVAGANSKYDQAIQTAYNKEGEAREKFAPEFAKNYARLRGENAKLELGKEAVGSKERSNTIKREGQREKHTVEERKAGGYLQQSGADQIKAEAARYKATHPTQTSSSQRLENQGRSIRSLIPQAVGAAQTAEKEGHKGVSKNFNNYVNFVEGKLGKTVPPDLVRQILMHWWQRSPYSAKGAVGGTHR